MSRCYRCQDSIPEFDMLTEDQDKQFVDNLKSRFKRDWNS